jgi:hypothetical protein
LGQSMHEVVHHSHPGASPTSAAICAAIRDGITRRSADEVFWRKDRTSFPVEYTSTPIIEGRKLLGAVVVFRDVSSRKLTEDRLRKALDELGALKERSHEGRGGPEAARPARREPASDDRSEPAAGALARSDPTSRADRRTGAGAGRHGQGAGVPRHPRAGSAGASTIRERQLRRDLTFAGRERAVRSREGRVHGARSPSASVASSRPKVARCCSTRSASCRSTVRRSCCECCKSARFNAWAAIESYTPRLASSRPAIAACVHWSRSVASSGSVLPSERAAD